MPDYCVCCGDIVPEGTQVCINCRLNKAQAVETDFDILDDREESGLLEED